MRSLQIVGILALIMILCQCESMDEPSTLEVSVPSGDGFDLLSDYDFFTGDLINMTPNEEGGVIPYDLNMALFSDYASKRRFVYVPEGETIPYDTSAFLSFPTGSVLIKHFYYTSSIGNDQHIETRLLIKRDNEWQPEIYEWNAEQTEAIRTKIGSTKQLTVEAKGETTTFNYLIPNVNQCKNCHAFNGTISPIGPNVHNLNRAYNYSMGSQNQLAHWTEKGILRENTMGKSPSWPAIDDVSQSLDDRARAYLAVNCASCHRLEGSAANSGLYLEYGNRSDSLSLGVYKGPVAAGDGSGGLRHVISPGEADQSILLYRMIADEVDERMPEIGRELLHDEGIALIRDWINGL